MKINPFYDRVEAPATPQQKEKLAKLSPRQITSVNWRVKKFTASSPTRPATTPPSAV